MHLHRSGHLRLQYHEGYVVLPISPTYYKNRIH